VPIKRLSIYGLRYCKNVARFGDFTTHGYIYIQNIKIILRKIKSSEHSGQVLRVSLCIEGYPVVRTSIPSSFVKKLKKKATKRLENEAWFEKQELLGKQSGVLILQLKPIEFSTTMFLENYKNFTSVKALKNRKEVVGFE
jgi:hypothetical protein